MKSANKILIMVISSAILPGISALNSLMATELEKNQSAIYSLRTIDQLNISQKRISLLNEIDELKSDNAQEIRKMENNMETWLSKEEDRINDEIDKARADAEQILSEEIDEYDNINTHVIDAIGDCDYINNEFRQILETEIRSMDVYLYEMVNGSIITETEANATLRKEIYDNLFYSNSLYRYSKILTTPQVREVFFSNSSDYANLTQGIVEDQNLSTVFPSPLDFQYNNSYEIINQTYTDLEDQLFGDFYIVEFNMSILWNIAESNFMSRWDSIWLRHEQRMDSIDVDETNLRTWLLTRWNSTIQEIDSLWITSDEQIQNLTELNENILFEFTQTINTLTDEKEQYIVTGLNQERSKLSISISFMGFAITLLGTAADVKRKEVEVLITPPKEVATGDKALVQGITGKAGPVELAPTKSEMLKMYAGPIIAIGLIIAGLVFTYTALNFYLGYSNLLG